MDFTAIKNNLEAKDYKVSTFATAKEAMEYLDREVDGTTVGIGGSQTAHQIGLYEHLSTHNKVSWHHVPEEGKTMNDIRMDARAAEIYFSSANGIAETGEIVNIDGGGNRVSETCYGHKKVYFIIGRNKITPDLDSAIYRARNVASPLNCKRFNAKTPCNTDDPKCHDCKSPQRICKVMTIHFMKPSLMEYEVVLIDEDLGY
ncbi:MAG: lactate utilization protein [Lachnospiraceae bacterium]|nr:lactate utilization protein [Lachnospiraceae bacterium]MBR3003910.1 lactate utilization protein [Lachnospiraceae bacterium]MBR6349940.1 lactate utilization protein [Lachnospiraceae bacterium]